jgi:hypothetical protein
MLTVVLAALTGDWGIVGNIRLKTKTRSKIYLIFLNFKAAPPN